MFVLFSTVSSCPIHRLVHERFKKVFVILINEVWVPKQRVEVTSTASSLAASLGEAQNTRPALVKQGGRHRDGGTLRKMPEQELSQDHMVQINPPSPLALRLSGGELTPLGGGPFAPLHVGFENSQTGTTAGGQASLHKLSLEHRGSHSHERPSTVAPQHERVGLPPGGPPSKGRRARPSDGQCMVPRTFGHFSNVANGCSLQQVLQTRMTALALTCVMWCCRRLVFICLDKYLRTFSICEKPRSLFSL